MSDLDGIDQWSRGRVLEARAKGEAADREVALEVAKARRAEVERETQVMLSDGANKLSLARTARIARTIETGLVTAGTVILAAIVRC